MIYIYIKKSKKEKNYCYHIKLIGAYKDYNNIL